MKILSAWIIVSAALLSIAGCTNGSGAIRSAERAFPDTAVRKAATTPAEDRAMEDVEGVVVYDGVEEELAQSSGLITIYGRSGEPLKVINRNDESVESLTGEEGDFYPFYFSNGASREFGIELRAVRRSREWIEVVIHETRERRTLGYVRADDPLFKLISWPDWVKGLPNIRFDPNTNPVLNSPNGHPEKVALPEEPLVKADEVRGDWARIRWTRLDRDELSADQIAGRFPEKVGWIRWRKEGKVIISEYYP